jgi:putative aldouronate transport system permease protein
MLRRGTSMNYHKHQSFTTIVKTTGAYYVMLVPCIIVVFIFSYIPLYGLVIAFQRYNIALGFSSPWVGFENFKHIFGQEHFIQTIWNTFYIAFFKITGNILISVIFALLLNEVHVLSVKKTFQTLVYLPHFLSWVIMANVFIDILSLDGIVNHIVQLMGMEAIPFLSNPKIFPWTMIVTDIWKSFGFGTVVYLAALTSIDPELYEAAVVDGAGMETDGFYYTTLPWADGCANDGSCAGKYFKCRL